MTQCVELIPLTQSGQGAAAEVVPSGGIFTDYTLTYAVGLRHSGVAPDPCTGFLLLSPSEYAAIQASPLNLSAEDGLTLSVAILGVWATAWAFKALAKALNTDGESSSS